jgi:hypothetical protein
VALALKKLWVALAAAETTSVPLPVGNAVRNALLEVVHHKEAKIDLAMLARTRTAPRAGRRGTRRRPTPKRHAARLPVRNRRAKCCSQPAMGRMVVKPAMPDHRQRESRRSKGQRPHRQRAYLDKIDGDPPRDHCKGP